MSSRLRAGLALTTAFALAFGWAGGTVAPTRAIPPALGIAPDPLDLSTVYEGLSGSADVTVTNSSAGSVTLDSYSVTGNSQFTITGGTCTTPQTLAASASCTVKVTFTPTTSAVLQTATLNILSASIGNYTSGVQGTGMDPIQVGPAVDFGDQPKGSTSAQQIATIHNMGDATVTPASATISGPNAADFAKVPGQDTCSGLPLTTTNQCLVGITFHPTGFGARTATLTISGPFPLGDRTIPLTGNGTSPYSTVAWGTTRLAGPNYTWNDGASLGRTVKSGVQQLHLIYQTDVVGGKDVTDKGPYLGVYYIHATSGATWGTPKRVNPSTQHGTRRALAAAGSRVYAVWVREPKWVKYSPTAARTLYVRVNTNHGAASAWKTAQRLTSLTGRVDYPIVAASGSYAHIVWTNSVTGAIKIANSSNGGSTWTIKSIGSTSYTFSEGREGVPYVAVSGANVIVAWATNNADQIAARVSTNHGSTWGPTQVITTTSNGSFSVAIRGTRAAVTWADANGVVVRVRTGGTWGAARVVAAPTGYDQYSPSVVLQDPNRLAVSWAQSGSNSDYTALMWAESPNNGVSFYQPQTVYGTGTASHTGNDFPSVQWPSVGTRIVAWNGFNGSFSTYRQYLRIGTGTPTGLTAPAALAISGGRTAAAGLTVHKGDGSASR